MKKLGIVLFLLIASVAYGEEKTIWLEPGVSAGAIRIKANSQDILKELGKPYTVKGNNIIHDIYYDYFFIEMSAVDDIKRRAANAQRGLKNETNELDARVLRITSYSQYSKTRGNIGIGSTLPAVLNIFGDTQSKIIRHEPLKVISCSGAHIFKYPENRITSLKEDHAYNGYMFEVDYFQEGISFVFKLNEGMPKVFAITISEKKECQTEVEME